MQNLDIIKSELNQIKVIKANDYKTICSAIDTLEKTRLECEHMRNEAKIEIENTKHDFFRNLELKLQEENSVFLNETMARFEQKLKNIEDNISGVFNNLFEKIGINNISAKQLAALIRPEISSVVNNSQITIEANLITIDKLKEALTTSPNLVYKINNDFKDNDCLCDTGLYLIKLDLNNTINTVLSNLRDVDTVVAA